MVGKEREQQTLAHFWKPRHTKQADFDWTDDERTGLLVCHPSGRSAPTGSVKLASFDLDHTLIKPPGKRRFSADETDWGFVFPEIPKRLRSLEDEGYTVVIFTNQNGLEKRSDDDGGERRLLFQAKVEELFRRLGLATPVLVAATKQNIYRKPRTGMWEHLVEGMLASSSGTVSMAESFFVGDAAGRPQGWRPGAAKDFAATDRKFALNLGLAFRTPEEFFLAAPDAPFALGFDPKSVSGHGEISLSQPRAKELVVLVGPPASGKTSLYEKHFRPHGYAWINQDVLKTRPQCMKALRRAISNEESVVIDGTNPSATSRAEWVALSREHGYHTRCVVLRTDSELAEHLNNLRAILHDTDKVPAVAYNVFKKHFVEPSLQECFDVVDEAPFIPAFENDRHRWLFMQYLH